MTNDRGRTYPRERQILPVREWPEALRRAWEEVCRPSVRLKKGGSGSHLDPESLHDYASRFGRYLGFLKRTGGLDPTAPVASLVTPDNVKAYMEDFEGKINSVTAWNCDETATRGTAGGRLAESLYRALSRRSSAHSSQTLTEGNKCTLGLLRWPHVRARCY